MPPAKTVANAARRTQGVRFQDPPAVADEEAPQRPTAVVDDDAPDRPAAVEDHADDDSESACHSIAGDTVDSEAEGTPEQVASLHDQRLAPREPMQGIRSRGRSCKYNSEPEVGNFGLFFGNWGMRGTNSSQEVRRARQIRHDRQIKKSPAHILVLVEASAAVEDLLRRPPEQGNPNAQGLDRRSSHEYFVQRGNEESAVLIAARMDNTTYLECLLHEINADHEYTQKGKRKMARTRMMVCKTGFKQNIGHLGKDIVVMGVHGHFNTMKKMWAEVWIAFWDRLAKYVRTFGCHFLAGDFNMSLTEVPKQLRSRGIECNCVAWYPWAQEGAVPDLEVGKNMLEMAEKQRLGFDSCGIFYLQRVAEITTPWSLNHLDVLTAVAGSRPTGLDAYHGQNTPGKHWICYRSHKHKEKQEHKNLEARLTDLLTLSITREELDSIPKREGSLYCPYLRLKQKTMDKDEWLVDGELHYGAHFPLCIFTKNSSARSEDSARRRASEAWTKLAGKRWCGQPLPKSVPWDGAKHWEERERPSDWHSDYASHSSAVAESAVRVVAWGTQGPGWYQYASYAESGQPPLGEQASGCWTFASEAGESPWGSTWHASNKWWE